MSKNKCDWGFCEQLNKHPKNIKKYNFSRFKGNYCELCAELVKNCNETIEMDDKLEEELGSDSEEYKKKRDEMMKAGLELMEKLARR